ncbi:cTAGE family member 4 [Plecturocebus cupreus]
MSPAGPSKTQAKVLPAIEASSWKSDTPKDPRTLTPTGLLLLYVRNVPDVHWGEGREVGRASFIGSRVCLLEHHPETALHFHSQSRAFHLHVRLTFKNSGTLIRSIIFSHSIRWHTPGRGVMEAEGGDLRGSVGAGGLSCRPMPIRSWPGEERLSENGANTVNAAPGHEMRETRSGGPGAIIRGPGHPWLGIVAHTCNPNILGGQGRRMNHLNPEVRDHPGQHRETLSLQKFIKSRGYCGDLQSSLGAMEEPGATPHPYLRLVLEVLRGVVAALHQSMGADSNSYGFPWEWVMQIFLDSLLFWRGFRLDPSFEKEATEAQSLEATCEKLSRSNAELEDEILRLTKS